MHIIMIGWLKGKPHPPKGYAGIERMIPILGTELIRQGHKVTLIAPPCSKIEGAEIIETTDFVEATNIANCLRADVVHDHSCWWTESPVRQGLRHPHLSTTHVNHAIGYTRNVVYLSRSQRTQHGLQTDRNLETSPVVYVPINPALKPKGLCRREYLLFLGMIVEWKGVYEAAQVARLLRRKLVIAGPAAGEYADKIKRDFGEDVIFEGEVGDPYRSELIERAWAMMCLHNNHGGWREPGAGVVGEALAFSTPVAIFPNGCLPEQIIDGQNGWVATTVGDMATNMEYTPYPTTFKPFQEQFSVENIVHQYLALYERVINGESWG